MNPSRAGPMKEGYCSTKNGSRKIIFLHISVTCMLFCH